MCKHALRIFLTFPSNRLPPAGAVLAVLTVPPLPPPPPWRTASGTSQWGKARIIARKELPDQAAALGAGTATGAAAHPTAFG